MYQSIYYDFSDYSYHLRDDKKGWSHFNYQPTYYKLDEFGTIPTLDGQRATPVKKYDKSDLTLYEKDVDKRTRLLIDNYFESDDVAEWQNIIYFDIECEIGGALTPEYIKSAPMKMTSVAVYDNNTKIHYCLVLDEKGELEKITQPNREVIPFKTEKKMLMYFLDLWETLDATIISGWNSGYFDIPYMYHRMCTVLSLEEASRLSPIRKISFNEYTPEQSINIGGINHLDYMLLFKKFVAKQEPSYKLGDIGEKYVKLGKIEYEGSLDRLFREDVNKFIEYNIRDVEIIIELEKKLKFIDLTITICHLCHVPYEQIYMATVLNDGAILTYLKRKGIASPNKPTTINPLLKIRNEEDDGYAGGYLKDPVPGLYEWVIDLDFTSLYPSIIRSLNIGIETFVGRIVNNDKYDNQWSLDELLEMEGNDLIVIEKLNSDFTTTKTQVTVKKIRDYIIENNIIVAASGALFRTDTSSVVCEVLTDWFNKRVEYKNLMKKAYKSGDAEKGEFYNKRQHAYKIKLNDVYGVFAINGWRYTDGHKMISSAITLTGQRVTQESIKYVNKWMNNKLNTVDKDYVVTSDTDSLFIQVKDILIAKGIDLSNKEACIAATLEIATEVQKVSNEFIGKFAMKAFNIPNNREHFFELKQEVVIERGYFSGKRRYAMYIVNKEGVPVEELDMKGLDLMKSNMPVTYKKFGESIIQEIMFGKTREDINKRIIDFKSFLKTQSWDIVAKPTGVKQIRKYIKRSPRNGEIFSELETKCPINTKAAIYTNDLLRFKKLDKQYSCFVEGDKMKYVTLKKNPYNIGVIGFKGNNEDPPFITSLIEEFVDKDEIFNSVLLNKLQTIYEDLGWEFISLNENVIKFFKF
jgi:DNA polymerase elongation subunit (family B)